MDTEKSGGGGRQGISKFEIRDLKFKKRNDRKNAMIAGKRRELVIDGTDFTD